MAYDQGQTLNPEVLPYLDSFSNNAQAGYQQDMGGLRRDAMRELDAEIAGQGLQGRQAEFQRRSMGQQFGEQADRFNKTLGMKRAELGETLRQRGQQRDWVIQDRNERLYNLRQEALAKRARAQDEMKGGMMGEIGSGVGTVVGGVVGGLLTSESGGWGAYPGAIGGGAAGGAIGSAI